MGRREVVRQSDFGFGQLSDDFAASDIEARARSLKGALNCRILNSFSIGQRYGSRRMATVSGPGIVIEIITANETSLLGVIRAGGADIYTQDGGLLQSVEGAPWAASDIPALTWHAREDTVYFTTNSFWPRVLSNSNGVWSFSLFNFDSGAGLSVLQPYYRFARKGITLTPSAATGAITFQFSDDVMTALHTGVRIRYGGSTASMKEIHIDSVVDARNGTGTVIDTLPPSYTVTVADASGFRAGENVEGHDSSATGIVTAIGGNNLMVLMSDGYASFITGTSAEVLIGPFSSSLVSATAIASPAPTTVWDEAAISPARGYPGDVFERSGRLGFADFPQIPGAVVMSAPGARNDFDVGLARPGDAIFWLLAEGGQRVRYCVSASTLTILTDRKVYYVPEDPTTPLEASTFLPIEVSPTGSSNAFPVTVEEGVIYVEAGGNRVVGILKTGNFVMPYQVTDLSRHGSELIRNPVSLAITNGNSLAPERYIFALNADGTQTCMFYDTNPPRLGLTPWTTAGAWLAMVSIKGIIYSLCRRTAVGADTYSLERLDPDAQMDASTLFSSSGSFLALTDDAGDTITDDAGDPILTDIGVMPHLAGQTVKLIRGSEYLGEFLVGANGSIPGIEAGDGDFEAGLHFDMAPVFWPPIAQDDQRAMFARRRISHASVRVKDSGVYTIGILGSPQVNIRSAYDQGEDIGAPPPLRSEIKRWPLSGYSYEPSVEITRPIPQPLTVLSIAQEVIVT